MSLDGGSGRDVDAHEHDLVMPGFRFHPTEEELVDFYLRRKVEGRRFNVDLIGSVDLYHFDPWELPSLAVIGDKEWFFYVPRDRKYRNGDRPNRVTASGYWKATGADRLIRSEATQQPIGLKKTLVFYSGKAPRGCRTSWIMNEYRLPPTSPQDGGDQPEYRCHKGEISLCRVYKRSGVDDVQSPPPPLAKSPSSRRSKQEKKAGGVGHSVDQRRATGLSQLAPATASAASLSSATSTEEDCVASIFDSPSTYLGPEAFGVPSGAATVAAILPGDEFSVLGTAAGRNYQAGFISDHDGGRFIMSPPVFGELPVVPLARAAKKVWPCNGLPYARRDF